MLVATAHKHFSSEFSSVFNK